MKGGLTPNMKKSKSKNRWKWNKKQFWPSWSWWDWTSLQDKLYLLSISDLYVVVSHSAAVPPAAAAEPPSPWWKQSSRGGGHERTDLSRDTSLCQLLQRQEGLSLDLCFLKNHWQRKSSENISGYLNVKWCRVLPLTANQLCGDSPTSDMRHL